MNHTAPARSEARRAPSLVLIGLAVVLAAIIGYLGYQSASSATPIGGAPHGDHRGAPGEANGVIPDGAPSPDDEGPAVGDLHRPMQPPALVGPTLRNSARKGDRGLLEALRRAAADGFVPGGASVFDEATPTVANLDPSLLRALRRAATDAAKDGVELRVTSGWRSAEVQEQLLREAVAEYGSEEEAERWVATPNTSAHVSGDAVDIGPSDATAWLSQHGAQYGLCQIYRNEPWHYELRPEATRRGCPPMYADPTQDPRMRQ